MNLFVPIYWEHQAVGIINSDRYEKVLHLNGNLRPAFTFSWPEKWITAQAVIRPAKDSIGQWARPRLILKFRNLAPIDDELELGLALIIGANAHKIIDHLLWNPLVASTRPKWVILPAGGLEPI